MSEQAAGTGTAASKPPRKRRSPAGWGILQEVSAADGTWRFAVDGCKSKKAAEALAEQNEVNGRIKAVYTHAEGSATPKKQTVFEWGK